MEKKEIKGYVVLNFGEYYFFSPTHSGAQIKTLGTFANPTKFEIKPAVLIIKEIP